jgi:hypothetical protein
VTDEGFDFAKAAEEAVWLLANPHFEEKPASIREFVGKGYLEIESLVRPGLLKALEDIFGDEVGTDMIARFERAMITGAIGIGKTTFASIALPYMTHWVLCLKDPQGYFGLLPGSRIAFMQMSTSEQQAAEVVFGDIFARIKHSPWFVNKYPHDTKFTKQIRFPKDIWILPGDSAETSFEGYNILGGILDEMDSHKLTRDKDYADVGYDAIHSRIVSRFPVHSDSDDDDEPTGHRGLFICIGQMKKASGFAARKYKEFMEDDRAYVCRMTIWESFGWDKYTRKDGTRKSFWYDIKRKSIVPTLAVDMIKNKNLIEVPNVYRKPFENSPEKALRDLAGIPPAASDPFISLVDRVESCRERWIANHGKDSPVTDSPTRPEFVDWFTNRDNADPKRGLRAHDPRKRHIHLDLATSGDGDALGFAMGHISALVEVEEEIKPYITIDCLLRIRAMPGTEILLSDVRRYIYQLREERGFKVYSVSMDGFQSTDTQQQLRKKRYQVDYLSVDKSTLAYEDLREAIYEQRIEFPPYLTYVKKGDAERKEVIVQELLELEDTGKKIDHPVNGSKDLADAVAGVTNMLMGDRIYRRGVTSRSVATSSDEYDEAATGTTGQSGNVLPFPGMGNGLQAPLPPSAGGMMGLTIPPRLQR